MDRSQEKFYVVKDFTGIPEGEIPVIHVISERDIFKYLMSIRNVPDAKIQIFTLGDCVYDSLDQAE